MRVIKRLSTQNPDVTFIHCTVRAFWRGMWNIVGLLLRLNWPLIHPCLSCRRNNEIEEWPARHLHTRYVVNHRNTQLSNFREVLCPGYNITRLSRSAEVVEDNDHILRKTGIDAMVTYFFIMDLDFLLRHLHYFPYLRCKLLMNKYKAFSLWHLTIQPTQCLLVGYAEGERLP
jgi:hypothetical protein